MDNPSLRGLRVGIVGGSVGGLAAARFLSERGAQVHVFERSPRTLADRGAGVAMDPGVASLLGLLHGRLVQGRVVIGRSGKVLWRRNLAKFMTSWSEIYRALQEQIPESCVHAGRRAVGCEDREAPTLTFEDGATESFDLVVGADGLGSMVRRTVDPDFEPRYCGYVAIRGFYPQSAFPTPVIRCELGRTIQGW